MAKIQKIGEGAEEYVLERDGQLELKFIAKEEFDRVRESSLPWHQKLDLIAQMNRYNTMFSIKRAGSGHIGTSYSAMDIVTYLYERYMNVKDIGFEHEDRDIYFSSKGHDAPGLYAVLYSLGIQDEFLFTSLRRLNGCDGHPDVRLPGIEANTGSLGMGISKAKGMILGKQYKNRKGQVFVLIGDGEFQEGQNFEALQNIAHQKVNETIVIMDHNKLQSDRQVQEIINLGEIENKVSTFGWHVERCDGHDFESIERVFKNIEKIKDKPKFIIMDTVKGKGVGFMEHPKELEVNDGFYRWHSGAPSDDNYKLAIEDLINGLTERCQQYDTKFFDFKFPQKDQAPAWSQDSEVIAKGYGRTLVELGKVNKDFVVIDADLSMDCQVLDFENAYPDRFFENGIAEQDMTSMACGFAGQGITPVINSFATFLAARANEQIYNAQTENRKIIYACHFAGILPSAPGKSHQSVRDISLFGALPNVTIMQACCEEEMEMVTRYAVMDSKESCMLRINIGTTPRKLKLPKDYQLTFGQGVKMNDRGSENIVLSYGPYVLNEVLKATDLLEEQKIPFTAVNMPWLNRFDAEWFKGLLKGCKNLYIVEDHMSFGGMGDSLIQFLNERSLLDGIRFHKWGFTEFPKCGTPLEALRAHKIDDESLAMRFKETLN